MEMFLLNVVPSFTTLCDYVHGKEYLYKIDMSDFFSEWSLFWLDNKP